MCERSEVGLDGGAQLHAAMVALAASISTHRAARGTRSAAGGALRAALIRRRCAARGAHPRRADGALSERVRTQVAEERIAQ
ncbi:hypothetical protein GCM10025869_23890 [Homoserinibacter gongjuensis]|uniref:Uncharacterized protein n=1 Tax=Homoserinibacter gongjuensis TaxID=1162968 RepID=A0ABQ6JU96_9MICO|nr:hypothetical protein GCM10025869_23890 [Homoserinibacter gongjuensis]